MSEPTRVQRAESEALRLLCDSGAADALPVDVYSIARRLGIQVVTKALDAAVSGMLIRQGDTAIIVVNADHHEHRRRFTIAHELGHFCLHKEQDTALFVDGPMVHYRNEVSATGSDPREADANAFAAALLMPADAIRRLLEGTSFDAIDDKHVKQVAGRFRVSMQALTLRMLRLERLDGMHPLHPF